MNVNPTTQKVIFLYHIIQVLGVIACGAVSIKYLLFYCLLLAIIPIVVFIIFLIASKCKYQDLVVILVHFNTILSTLWFITVFPSFVLASIMCINSDIFTYDYSDTADVKVLVVAVITGVISIGSATFSFWGIMMAARDVLLSSKSCQRSLDNGVVPVPQPVTCTDRNGMGVGQENCDEPLLNL